MGADTSCAGPGACPRRRGIFVSVNILHSGAEARSSGARRSSGSAPHVANASEPVDCPRRLSRAGRPASSHAGMETGRRRAVGEAPRAGRKAEAVIGLILGVVALIGLMAGFAFYFGLLLVLL